MKLNSIISSATETTQVEVDRKSIQFKINAVSIEAGSQQMKTFLIKFMELTSNVSGNINLVLTFDNDKLPDIMRQLSRWYDIDVAYKGAVAGEHYSGGIRRQVNISEVLKTLETPGGVEFLH